MRGLVGAAAILIVFLLPALARDEDWEDCKDGNPERSIAGCTRIIMEANDPPKVLAVAYNNRGVAYKAKGELLRAFADYTEALRLNSTYARAFYNRGLAHLHSGALARALEDFDAALQVEPDYVKALASRGALLAEHDEIEGATRDLAKAADLQSKLHLPVVVDLAEKIVDAAPDSDKTVDVASDAAQSAIARLGTSAAASSSVADRQSRTASVDAPIEEGSRRDSAHLKPGERFQDCSACPEMLVLPAGEFTMGSPLNEAKRDEGEGPQHKVSIARPFAVGRFEVTVEQFEAFVKATGYSVANECSIWNGREWTKQAGSFRVAGYQQTGRHPATCLNWNDAKAYVTWLTQVSGKAYRLLSEAEWEYAARAGTTTPYHFGSDTGTLCQFGNGADRTAKTRYPRWTTIADCADGHANTAPAGSFKPNAFGLHDMHGNVSEWVEDCYKDDYRDAPTDGSSVTSSDCKLRVQRGGSWIGQPKALRSAVRLRRPPDDRYSNVGFRVATSSAN